MNTSFHYPSRALAGDYARSVSGLAIAVLLPWLVRPAAAVTLVMGACAALFLVYFGRTVCRHLTHIELDEAGLCARGPLGAAIRWDSLCSVRLEYYSTRRDREEGWMQLKLRDAHRAIRIDSQLEGFDGLARAVARQARQRGVALDATTRENLRQIGVRDA
jgi:hypothetical protein